MALEIERKFLIDKTRCPLPAEGVKMVQGYLMRTLELSIRLRLAGGEAFLTIKGAQKNFTRSEFEYKIPAGDAEKMLAEFADGKLVSKTRYFIPAGKHTWEVDIFEGANFPLAVAEIELSREDETFELPDWITTEVTGDKRYNNTYLAEHPYPEWKNQEL